jgi:1,4-alpha-glucan branching enzyme
MPGDRWQQLANVRAYLTFMWSHPGKQLLFMGSEFGQQSEWNQEHGLEWWILDQPSHQGLKSLVSTLNRLYLENPPMWQLDHFHAGFTWIDGGHADANVLTFLRYDESGSPIACVINFAGNPHHNFKLGLPLTGNWDEILNTDAEEFGGSGVGNFGRIAANGEGTHGQPHSATISVPPLGALWFKPSK